MKNFKVSRSKWIGPFIFAISIIIAYKLIDNIYPILLSVNRFFVIIKPFIIGFVIAYFLNPPCCLLCKRLSKVKFKFLAKRANGVSILLVYIIIILIIRVAFSYILPIITKNITELIGLIPQYYKNILDFVIKLDEDGVFASLDLDSLIRSFSVQDMVSRLSIGIGSIGGYAKVMTSGIVNVFLSTIISIYMLLHKKSLLALINRLALIFIKDSYVKVIKEYLNKTNEIFYKFISTQFLDSCIVGTLATIVLWIIGVKYAVTLGILLGMCNMIPYFGSIFASVLTVVITIFTNGFNIALVTGISLMVLQQIDGNVIGPKLIGDSLNLNPIWIIFLITVGGSYFGIVGMFISVPVGAVLKVIINNSIEIYEKQRINKDADSVK